MILPVPLRTTDTTFVLTLLLPALLSPVRWWGNKKLRFALIGVAVGMVVEVGLLVWPEYSPVDPSARDVRLSIIKRIQQQGKEFVVFRLDVLDKRRVCIQEFTILGEKAERPRSYSQLWGEKVERPLMHSDLWSGAAKSPTDFTFSGSVTFGVACPTNLPVWRLRLSIQVENSHRWKSIWGKWNTLRISGKSLSSATSEAWHHFYTQWYEQPESDPITNTPPNGTLAQ